MLGIMCMESDKSYGSFEKNNLPYKETDAIKPTNVYEISKACSGLIAEAYSNNYGMPVFTVHHLLPFILNTYKKEQQKMVSRTMLGSFYLLKTHQMLP